MSWLIFSIVYSIVAGLLAEASIPQTTQKQAITVVVLDSSKRPVRELAVERIRISGIAAVAVHAEPLSGPRHIVLLLDLSQSSRNSGIRWKNMVDTCKRFLKEVQPDDWIALHAFGENHRVLASFTHESSQIEQKLDALRAETEQDLKSSYGLGTNVATALQNTLASERPELCFGDVVVVVSDGEYSNLDGRKLQKIHQDLIDAGIRVYLLRTAETIQHLRLTPGMPLSVEREIELGALKRQLRAQQELVVPVGGAVLSPGEPIRGFPDFVDHPFKTERISGASKALALLIRSAHKLELDIEEPVRKPRSITMELAGDGDEKKDRLELQYPRWVMPPRTVLKN
ncbi:MAG TPA: VWA domain-containing protein [Acidobacteriota bacterium]|nr:VWA domain-containing protein [Acidobacteriota bacterium]